jgi:precorrin-6x reductase
MSKVKKEQAISKIKSTDALEVSLIVIKRDAPESQKNAEIEKLIKIIRAYRDDQRGIVACIVKEK